MKDDMKIVVMNTSDIEGGAARCAYRLYKGLRSEGVVSTYIVQEKCGTDSDVMVNKTVFGRLAPILRPAIDRIPVRAYRRRQKGYFSTGLVTSFSADYVNKLSADVINLHYVASGFLPITALRQFNKPIVWTLHDSWPFTGGCHLQGDCHRYRESCGACPMLGSQSQTDLSYRIWKRKMLEWKDLNITVATDSHWLSECARSSSIFSGRRVETINPGLDLKRYRPIEKHAARALLSLPPDKKLILFGAMHSTSDPNKGFQLLQPAIKKIAVSALSHKTELVIFGASEPADSPDLGIKSHYMGRLHDDVSLAALYSAADVMVVPSLRESFGQTASEAMACGTPVVAFAATGLLDIIDHKTNGYLATPFLPDELASGIAWVLSLDGPAREAVSGSAREKAEKRFSVELMTKKYMELFVDLIEREA